MGLNISLYKLKHQATQATEIFTLEHKGILRPLLEKYPQFIQFSKDRETRPFVHVTCLRSRRKGMKQDFYELLLGNNDYFICTDFEEFKERYLPNDDFGDMDEWLQWWNYNDTFVYNSY